MKSVLISIKPKYCELIAESKKTVEVRKSMPELKTPFKCYIYCTKKFYRKGDGYFQGKSCGKVIGEFICDEICCRTVGNFIIKEDGDKALSGSCVSQKELYEYLGWVKGIPRYEQKRLCFYAWHISELKIYDKPKDLSEFYRFCLEFQKDEPICEGCDYEHTEYSGLDCPPYFECKCDGLKPIQQPPQSWCYVEELKE